MSLEIKKGVSQFARGHPSASILVDVDVMVPGCLPLVGNNSVQILVEFWKNMIIHLK